MTIPLYDASVVGYLQTLGGVAGFLEKARTHFGAGGVDLEEIVETRFAPDMKPFRFQIRSLAHHSIGAIEGLRNGMFAPPGPAPQYTYAELQALITDAHAALTALSADEINGYADREVIFAFGEHRLRFTSANFILSFSLPNFHFHAATAYDILRMKGLPLEKRDYLGRLRFEPRGP